MNTGRNLQVLGVGGQVNGRPSGGVSIFLEATIGDTGELGFFEQLIGQVQSREGPWLESADRACLTHLPRFGIAAARLQNETILLVGGVAGSDATQLLSASAAEIFYPRVYATR